MTLLKPDKPDFYVTLHPIASNLRVYYTKEGYDQRKPFILVGTVIHTAEDIVILQAAHGIMCRESILAIADKLYQAGNNSVHVKRAPGKQAPFAVQVIHGTREDTHIVDLVQMANDGLIPQRGTTN